MLTRVIVIVLLCCSLFSCHYKKAVYPNAALQYSLSNIERQYSYSHDGFVAVTAVFKLTENKNVADSALYYSYISNYYRFEGNNSLQLIYADSLLSIVNQSRFEDAFHKERAIGYINKAHSLYFMKRYKDCYYYYYNGSVEADKANDPALTEDVNNYLNMFLYEEGNYAKAIVGYKKGLKDITGKNKSWQRQITNIGLLDNIGICFIKQKKADSAKLYLEEAVHLCEVAKPTAINQVQERWENLAVVYGNLAQAYTLLGEWEKAEQTFQQSISINSQPDYAKENALITQQQLAELYYDEKKTPEFYNTLLLVKRGLDTIPNENVAIRWNDMMSQYYSSIHQPQKAWLYLNAYKQLTSKPEEPKATLEWDILDQMNLMQSRYNVALLKKNNQIKTGFLWAVSIFSLLSAALAIMIFVHFKKSKKSVRKLMLLNKEIRQKQTLLNETLADLEKQNIEKQHILNVVAHDLRNPLSAIHTLAGVVLDDYEYEEDNREYLQLIRSACTESNQLINSILEIAENTDVKYTFEAVDVNELLAGCIQLLGMKASEKNQRIQLVTSQQKAFIYADTGKINRVIGNLVTNAIKFSPSGSCIEVSTSLSEHHVLIKVRDEGIGIPEQYQDKIFNAFTDAKRVGTAGEKTFGLGLSITKQIVEKHHGRIWFESIENKGTTFFVEISKMDDVQTPVMMNMQTIQEG